VNLVNLALAVQQQDENRRLRERNASLAAEVMDLKHGLDAIEERARSEMGMIKSGETYYQIVKVPPDGGDGPAE
jgi:cell division protein FtsB